MPELSARDAKLIQHLNEAYGKERELETALQAHIAMTERAPYRKRLQQHLVETRRHAREVERQIKRLGGTAQTVDLPVPDAVSKGATVAVEIGSRAVAAAQGPLHALRGTSEPEKMLKNAKSEYADEHEEIATYTAIATLADALGERDVVTLARAILREEQGMARFLERQIPALVKAVMQAEIPAAERRAAKPKPRRRGARSNGKAAGAGRKASRGAASGKARAKSARSGAKASAKRPPSRRSPRATAARSAKSRGGAKAAPTARRARAAR